MITKRTTFVLGAGASMAYGFPSGKTLKALIWRRLSVEPSNSWDKLAFPEYFYKAAGYQPEDISKRQEFEKKVQEFCQYLSLSPDETIDYFLEHVGDDAESKKNYRLIGCLAIALILLEREQKSYLFQDWMEYNSIEKEHKKADFLQSKRIRPDDGHWYQLLFNQMCRDCQSIEAFSENQVSFITFNYDRSLEYYFLCALMSKFKANEQKAADVLNKMYFVHVYGQLGELRELISQSEPERKKNAVAYSALSEPEHKKVSNLKEAAQGIQLIWDDIEKNSNLQKARELIYTKCNKIIFLGFGYDPINLGRIMPQKEINSQTFMRSYGTIYGVSKQRLQHINANYILKHPNGMTQGFFGGPFMGHETNEFEDCKIYDYLYNAIGLLK